MGKPGPKPKRDSLTDAPVMSVKMPRSLLKRVDESASAQGMSRPDFVRESLDWWSRLTPAQKAKIVGWTPPKEK